MKKNIERLNQETADRLDTFNLPPFYRAWIEGTPINCMYENFGDCQTALDVVRLINDMTTTDEQLDFIADLIREEQDLALAYGQVTERELISEEEAQRMNYELARSAM